MSYDVAYSERESNSDRLFIGAVSLGCAPIMGASTILPLWRCTCPDWLHAAHGTTIITHESLDALRNVLRKRAAR
jgi:hypothetical protein